MSEKGEDVLWSALGGAILGGVVGHAIGGGVLGTVVGGSIGAVVCGVIALILPEDVREFFLKGLGWLDCCLTSVVLVVTSVVTIAGFLLWHNLLLAALAGESIIVMMLIGLSVVASSYKAGSQSPSSRCAGFVMKRESAVL